MRRVIALGFFDGVHLGHGALLRRVRERAEALGAAPAVLSFDAPPMKAVRLILSAQDRADAIRRYYGIGEVLFLHFGEALRHMPWEEFIERLVSDFDAAHLVAGYDFRFGYRGAGNAALLQEKCASLGVGCDIIGKVELDGAPVSSTRIRALLEAGELAAANRLMGHPWFLTDRVRTGFRLGHTLGYPTVNQRLGEGVLVPRRGVYRGTATLLVTGQSYPCLTNIGVRPTVSEGEAVSVESWLRGYAGSLYGEPIRVELEAFLRPEQKFPTPEALAAQIAADAASL